MGSNIMKNSCWVIKVTYLNHKEVNFNEAYWTLDKCLAAMRNKIKFEDWQRIDDYTYMDVDEDIIYEAKLVDIFEEVK